MITIAQPQQNTLGYWAVQAIQKHLEKVISHEPEVLKDNDPEQLHQMRVGMRRLRSAMAGFAPVLTLPKAAHDKNIGRISKTLGTLRDLDVLLDALLNRYYPNLPSKEQETLEKALEALAKQRKKAFKLVKSTVEHKRYYKLKEQLQDWVTEPQFTSIEKLPIEEVLPDLLLPQISHLFLHPGWQVGEVTSPTNNNKPLEQLSLPPSEPISSETVEMILETQGEPLHSLRKEIKRVRYQMSLFTDFYGSEYEAYLDDMKTIQEYLGDIQDSVVLAEIMTDVIESNLGSELPTLASLLAQSRYQAWKKWQPLQQRYLTSETRQGFRSELINPIISNQ